jgi:hypothetical protein
MKHKLALLTALLLGTLAGFAEVENQFVNPPITARPWVYWWWMGRMSRESITRDLEALKVSGIGWMLLFHCDDGLLPGCLARANRNGARSGQRWCGMPMARPNDWDSASSST